MKGKKMAIASLILLVCLDIPAVFSATDSFTVEYKFNPVQINGQWMIEDTFFQQIPGEPLVVYYPARILLPQDTVVKAIKVTHSTPTIERGLDILWGQPPTAFGDTPEKTDKKETVYDNKWYPKEIYKVVSVESFRGSRIVNVMLYPVQYKPKSQTVKFYPKLYVTVQVEKDSKHELRRGLKRDKEAVRAMVDNPEVLGTYTEEGEINLQDSSQLPSEPHEYIIITNSALAPVFEVLSDYKNNFLSSPVEIVDVEWIYSRYEGGDEQEKIRTFMFDAYKTWGTVYCLLGGDVSVIPYRAFFVEAEGHVDKDMASDMYYGCLDGTFDANGNHIYGEPEDDVDWLAEVFIGRAPVETELEADMFVNKVINYELAEKPMSCQFHQARLFHGNDPDSRQIAWDCEQWVPGEYLKRELFEEDGPIKKEQWIGAWGDNPLLFQHTGDGTATGYVITFEVEEPVIWNSDDIFSLNNDFWPVHMSVASFCGEFEADDCLAEAYVNNKQGASACIMNSSLGWYSSEDASRYSGDFLETMFRSLFSEETEHLGALLHQAKSYWVSSAEKDPVYRWCYYEINLIGDPETPVLTQRVVPQSHTVTITNPQDGDQVYGIVNITVSKRGCIHRVEFYINGGYVGTDESGPIFSYMWDTTSYPEDNIATILVKGYCGEECRDEDSVLVIVNNGHIEITNPEAGEVVFETVVITTETRGIARVEFYIDTIWVGEDSSSPFQYTWDTCRYSNGPHTIVACGYDDTGVLVGQDDVQVIVSNDEIEITNPQDGEWVSGTVTVSVHSHCVYAVLFEIDGEWVGEAYPPPPYEYVWDTCGYSNGEHTIKAIRYYGAQGAGYDEITVHVANFPFVTITNPQRDEEVSGTVTITTNTDCVNKVKFYIDDPSTPVFTDTQAPFEYIWDTTTYTDDEHTITVEGYYGDQLQDTDTVTVIVNNCYVKITNPLDGETVSGTITITVDAACVNVVKFYIDDFVVPKFIDTQAPFECIWKTTDYSNGPHTILVEGYSTQILIEQDEVTVTVNNSFVLFLFMGFCGLGGAMIKRH